MFPPFIQISIVLQMIENQVSRVILIVPVWQLMVSNVIKSIYIFTCWLHQLSNLLTPAHNYQRQTMNTGKCFLSPVLLGETSSKSRLPDKTIKNLSLISKTVNQCSVWIVLKKLEETGFCSVHWDKLVHFICKVTPRLFVYIVSKKMI